ncbi:MAG: TonB-dependent receptor [Brevinematales bacterium]|nr:TonB-dependent receptor [Brevinematales bacterium]
MRKFLIGFSLVGSFLWGETLTLAIQEKGKPVIDATVFIVEKKIQHTTDETGVVEFELEEGVYTVVVAKAGYEKYTSQIVLPRGGTKKTLSLTRIRVVGGEITVEAKREKGKVPAVKVISQEEVKGVSQSFYNDAIKVLQTMPGVGSSGSLFDASMYIQGGDKFEQMNYLDGLVILQSQRWNGRISMFNPNWVETIDLYTAGYPASFAQGLSGQIIVKVKEGNKENLKGFWDMSSATMEMGLEGPLSANQTFYVNIRRTFYDLTAPFFMPDRAGQQFPYTTDGIFKWVWRPTPQNKLSFLFYAGDEGMKWKLTGDPQNGEPLAGDFNYGIWQAISSVKYDQSFNEKDACDLVLGMVYLRNQGKLYAAPVSEQSWDQEIVYVQSGANLYLNSFSGHKVLVGGNVLYPWMPKVEYTGYFYRLDPFGNWTNYASYETRASNITYPYANVYLQDNWEFLPSWILEMGGRGEYFHRTAEYAFTPVGGLKWEVTENLSLYTRGGYYTFFPWFGVYLDKEYGNPNLTSQKSRHLMAGIEYSSSLWVYRVEGFGKWYHDLIAEDTDKNFNNDKERIAYGGSLFLQKKKKENDWWSGWITYTYVHADERITNMGTPDPFSPSPIVTNTWYTPGFLREHTLSVTCEFINRYQSGKKWIDWLYNWKVGVEFQVMSGHPYTPVTNFIVQTIPGVGTQYYLFQGAYNSEWTPLYHRLDLKITMPSSPFDFLKVFGLKFNSSSYIAFLNIYNHENIVDYQYAVVNNELKRIPIKDFSFMILGGMRIEF